MTIRNIVVIRSGALGDVLVARGALFFLRRAFPEARLTLLAPGERGRLFLHFSWVDRVLDWESAECAWLFSGGESAPGERLTQAFTDADLVFSFAGRAEAEDAFALRVRDLSPGAVHGRFSARPPEGTVMPVGRWLLESVAAYCRGHGLLRGRALPEADLCLAARFVVDAGAPDDSGKTLVIHPGSGSAGKNWPVENFACLAAALLRLTDNGGDRFFSGLTVTAGEADGDLGERLRDAVPGAVLAPPGSLTDLAALLARARGYVGNDSGVSHLASAVRARDGAGPLSAVVFGATDAAVWSPPGALVLAAGPALDGVSPESAARRTGAFFQDKAVFCLDKDR